jgi:deoxyadenosine/deoxycytidine kinase
MKQALFVLVLIGLTSRAAYSDDVPASAASTTEQAQARQFGIYFGGMASQYDLCVKKGFLPKGDQSAEQIAKSILEKMRQFSKEPDQFAYVQEGWDAIKQEIAKRESEYTQEKCSGVAKEWANMVATMTPK